MIVLLVLALDFDPLWFPCDGPVLGIPHGLNVLTNLPFLFVGLWGLWRLQRVPRVPGRADAVGLWVSTALLCFGSGAYHLWLTPFTLGLDRLCIAGIMGSFAAYGIVEALPATPSRGRSTLLVGLAIATVGVWALGGTSIPYGVFQAVGGVAVLVLYVRAWRRGVVKSGAIRAVALFVLFYGCAKLMEVFDQAICDATGVFGGHPIKHILAAAGLLALVPLTEGRYRAHPPEGRD